jgi:hypothetical protein
VAGGVPALVPMKPEFLLKGLESISVIG